MRETAINSYGDKKIDAGAGHGVDVASQRADDLDQACLDFIRARAANRPVHAVDLGCGQCGQALRMARAGASVTALDAVYQFDAAVQVARQERLALRCGVADLRVAHLVVERPVDVVLCQRTIHYLAADGAGEAVRAMHSMLARDGRLFLSASGIDSELGKGYPAKAKPLADRMARLAPAMRKKHNILEPVCLYSEADLKSLLESNGFRIVELYRSAFGNIKAIADVA